MITDFLSDIEQHFKSEYPREGCGILCVQKGKMKWIPCTNIAEDGEEFVINSQEYLRIKRSSDIVGIVHSHPDATASPSEADILYCNALGIPYYIFSYPNMDLEVLLPKINVSELYGREYKFGVQDCFEAARDYLNSVGIAIPKRILFEDDWWKKDLDYFTDEMLDEWGFKPIELNELQENDVITFNVNTHIANHCGIYLGNDIFYHHAIHRLSCRENLYPFWAKYIKRAYRYVT